MKNMNYSQIAELNPDALENVTGGVLPEDDYSRAWGYINEIQNSNPQYAEFLCQQLGGYHSAKREYTYDEFMTYANQTYRLLLSRNAKPRHGHGTSPNVETKF